MKIIFSGGGTLGPVTPLLAVHEIISQEYKNSDFLWVGTKKGPEINLVRQYNIRYATITCGKLRRYLSLLNLLDLFKIMIGFFQALILIWKENPDICISAGGYVSVPVHCAAWLYGAETWIHQQDVKVGLANKLMSPFATQITTAMKKNLENFPKKNTAWLGNPIRQEILTGDKQRAIKLFNLKPDLPVIFATGGGTGSLRVNQIIVESVQHLRGICQIIHLSGKERPQELVENAQKHFDDYQVHQFFTTEMKDAYAAADLVISRGGFGSLAEIAALSKPAILIPKPGHQEENVSFLAKEKAVVLANERLVSGHSLAGIIKELLGDQKKSKQMGKKLNELLPKAKKGTIVKIIKRLKQ